jgi:hypothetical protein
VVGSGQSLPRAGVGAERRARGSARVVGPDASGEGSTEYKPVKRDSRISSDGFPQPVLALTDASGKEGEGVLEDDDPRATVGAERDRKSD